jgi:hypothetical protein
MRENPAAKDHRSGKIISLYRISGNWRRRSLCRDPTADRSAALIKPGCHADQGTNQKICSCKLLCTIINKRQLSGALIQPDAKLE